MEKAKEMLAADALATAIEQTKKCIVLKRWLAVSVAINVVLLFLVILGGLL